MYRDLYLGGINKYRQRWLSRSPISICFLEARENPPTINYLLHIIRIKTVACAVAETNNINQHIDERKLNWFLAPFAAD